MKHIYSINNLSYKIEDKMIIDNISCNINNNKITNIKGVNGAGKTTFLKLIYGLYKPSSGSIIKHFDSRKIKLSYLFQNSIVLNRSIKDNLNHALYCQEVDKLYWDDIIKTCAEDFELEYLLNLDIRSLSGGEFQLITILRSILNSPNILFLDEPTNNLDTRNIKTIANIINTFYEKGSSIVMVSHDKDLLDMISYDEIFIDKGKIIYD